MRMDIQKADRFSVEFVTDLKQGIILKDTLPIYSDDFSEGIEELHRERFVKYMGSCSCFLMDKRIMATNNEL